MPVATLLDEVDLSYKTIVVFTTHAGGVFANALTDLEAALPESLVIPGPAIHMSSVFSARTEAEVERFLEELSLN